MSDKRITVSIRTVYGKDVIYPACPASVLFAELAGTRTLTDTSMVIIRRLGYEISVEAPSVVINTMA